MKIIAIRPTVETCVFFLDEMVAVWRERGVDVLVCASWKDETTRILDFATPSDTVVFTFNFQGILGNQVFRLPDGTPLIHHLHLKTFSMQMEPPYYFHGEILHMAPEDTYIAVDQCAVSYIEHYFKNVKNIFFLPLVGTIYHPREEQIPVHQRTHDFIFTGIYIPPEEFDVYITRSAREYEDFYRGILDDMISNPQQTFSSVVKKHLLREEPNLSDQEFLQIFTMQFFLELYVRYYMRGNTIKALADSGHQVLLYGTGWDKLDCIHKENLILGRTVDSATCLRETLDSKISVNVMPWFKMGAHDRIFNAMLNGTIIFTDTNPYIDSFLKTGENGFTYPLGDFAKIPDIAEQMLSSNLQDISDAAYETASHGYTWKAHGETLLHAFRKEIL